MAKAKELQELGDWKVGQEVYLDQTNGFKAIKRIERITDGRNGTIYVYGYSFDKQGHQRGDSWNRLHIVPVTDKHRLSIKGANARRRLTNVEWFKLSNEEAIQIENLLNENGIQTRSK